MRKTKNSDIYDPENNSTDAMLPEVIKQILKSEGELGTKDLAEKIDENGIFTEDTVRTKLYYAIPDVEEQVEVEVYDDKGGSPGSPEWQWRYSKDE